MPKVMNFLTVHGKSLWHSLCTESHIPTKTVATFCQLEVFPTCGKTRSIVSPQCRHISTFLILTELSYEWKISPASPTSPLLRLCKGVKFIPGWRGLATVRPCLLWSCLFARTLQLISKSRSCTQISVQPLATVARIFFCWPTKTHIPIFAFFSTPHQLLLLNALFLFILSCR